MQNTTDVADKVDAAVEEIRALPWSSGWRSSAARETLARRRAS
jgi:hypothetical protein